MKESQQPQGTLTSSQFEIMEVFWDSSVPKSVKEVWKELSEVRQVGKTTILNQISRLEKRFWLKRILCDGINCYQPAMSREQTEARMAEGFVDDFFNGSASSLVQSCLGSSKFDEEDLKRMRDLVDRAIMEGEEENPSS